VREHDCIAAALGLSPLIDLTTGVAATGDRRGFYAAKNLFSPPMCSQTVGIAARRGPVAERG
jgi:hypothetical protein